MQVGAGGFSFNDMEVVGRQRIAERAQQGIVQGFRGGVLHLEFEKGRRQTGVKVIQWDERVESGQPDLAGELFVDKIQPGNGELTGKLQRLEMRQAGEKLAAGAEAKRIEPRTIDRPRIRRVQIAL